MSYFDDPLSGTYLLLDKSHLAGILWSQEVLKGLSNYIDMSPWTEGFNEVNVDNQAEIIEETLTSIQETYGLVFHEGCVYAPENFVTTEGIPLFTLDSQDQSYSWAREVLSLSHYGNLAPFYTGYFMNSLPFPEFEGE